MYLVAPHNVTEEVAKRPNRSTGQSDPDECRTAGWLPDQLGHRMGTNHSAVRPSSLADGGDAISGGALRAITHQSVLLPRRALRGSGDVIAAIRVDDATIIPQSISPCSSYPLSTCTACLALSRPRSAAPALPGRSPVQRLGGGRASLLVTGSRPR